MAASQPVATATTNPAMTAVTAVVRVRGVTCRSRRSTAEVVLARGG